MSLFASLLSWWVVAADPMDISSAIGQSGVSMLAVVLVPRAEQDRGTFVDRWVRLLQEYEDDGLSVIAVADPTFSRDGTASGSISWFSDIDGSVFLAYTDLREPSSERIYLWDWKGNLVLSGGDFADAKDSIEFRLSRPPRLYVVPEEGISTSLRGAIVSALLADGHFDVVSDEATSARLAELRKLSASATKADESRIEPGQELAANHVLEASVDPRGMPPLLTLRLVSIETAMVEASISSPCSDREPSRCANLAVEKLVKQLRRPPRLPFSVKEPQTIKCGEPPLIPIGSSWGSGSADVKRGDVPSTEAIRSAEEKALLDLATQVCGKNPNLTCKTRVASSAKPWGTGTEPTLVCAGRVLVQSESKRVRRETTLVGFQRAIDSAVGKFLAQIRSEDPGINVLVPEDLGLIGGARATWLHARLSEAVVRAGGRPTASRATGSAKGRIQATILESPSDDGHRYIEVHLKAGTYQPLKLSNLGTFRVAEDVAGSAPTSRTSRDFSDAEVNLSVVGASKGEICEGDRVQLLVEVTQDSDVMVFNLFGERDVHLLFPNEIVSSTRVQAGKAISLTGEHTFDAVIDPSSEHERYLVVAVPAGTSLGPMGTWTPPCKVDGTWAPRLRNGDRGVFPRGAKLRETGVRVVRERRCSNLPSAEMRLELQRALMEVPSCAR
jgi:hypothetical protein